MAFASDGTLYVGFADRQSVAAIDVRTGVVTREVILDHPEIASTKELVTMRLDAVHNRLVIANGSDESVTILSLPDLAVVREIAIEGEAITDALPDPAGRYLYVLGRRVHVYDFEGNRELRTLPPLDPMAMAATSTGSVLAVASSEDFGNTRATVVSLYETTTLQQVSRDPLQTDREIRSLLFAADDRSLVAVASDWFGEKPIAQTAPKEDGRKLASGKAMRVQIEFGDLVSSDHVCLPDRSGPQIVIPSAKSSLLFLAESRCSVGATFNASRRNVTFASLYGVSAYALALEPGGSSLFVTDRGGFITQFRLPEPQPRKN
ncbi:MAG: hypothetical protein ABI718_01250 [Acidobacteriota bacterium]